jgi:hypothetical protein
MVAEAVKQIQAECFRLEVTQTLNGHRHTDSVPGSNLSYGEQRKTYESGLERLKVCYPAYIDIILVAQEGSKATGLS